MSRFWKRFLNLEGSLVHYILGTAALTIVLQFFYDLFDNTWKLWGTGLLALVLLVVTFTLVWNEYRKESKASTIVVQGNVVDQRRGVIILVGFNSETPLVAIEHHVPVIKHCWLIASSESSSVAHEIKAAIHEKHLENIKVHDVMEYLVDDIEDTENAWKIVDNIYSQEAPRLGLSDRDIIADITGASKPMTAGMALACGGVDRDMQYVKTPRDEQGNPVTGAPRVPVLIRTQFIQPPAESGL